MERFKSDLRSFRNKGSSLAQLGCAWKKVKYSAPVTSVFIIVSIKKISQMASCALIHDVAIRVGGARVS